MKRRIGMYVLWTLTLASTYVYTKFQGGYVAWFLFIAVVVIAGYEAMTAKWAGSQLKSERQLSSTKLTAGNALQVDMMIRNRSNWPLVWLAVEDLMSSRLFLQTGANRSLLFPGFRDKIRVRYTIPNLPRGKFDLSDTVFYTGDLFGLFRKKVVHERLDQVTVYPKMVPIDYWHTVNKFNAGLSYAQNRMAEDSNNVMGVREYAQGDRLSRIHWRATARTGSMKSKEFELHVTNDLMFFLNQSRHDYTSSMQYLFELGVTTVASLIRYSIGKKYSAGLVSYGRERKKISLSRHPDQFQKTLEHLAIVQPDGDDLFHETVLREVNYLPRGSTAVLITPIIREETVRLIGFLEHRKVQTECFFLTGERDLTQEERERIGRMTVFGVATYVIRDEQEMVEAVKGGTGFANLG